MNFRDTRGNTFIAVSLALVAVVITLSLALKGSTGLQWILSGLTVGSIYALIGLGFSIIYASTRVINFAQGEFSMLGGLLFYTFSTRVGLPVPIGFLLAVIVVTGLGAAFERLAVHRLRNEPVITVIIVTIGLAIFLRAVGSWAWGTNPLRVSGFSGEKAIRFLGASLVPQNLWVFGFTIIAVLAVFFFFSRTLAGKGMRAAATNSDAASMVGVSTSMTSLTAWTLAAALGAAAGVVVAPITFAAYNVGLGLSLAGFTAAIIGGLGNFPGAIVGGLMLGLLEQIAAGALPQGLSGYKTAVIFLVLILVLLVRPQGLLGKPEDVKV